MPKVSVIVPVYNVERYLKRALDSLLGQTYGDFEAICVDDGATDGSGKILEEYAQKDSRVKVVKQVNQGLSMARNNGLKEAVGEYVFFFDSDDAMHPQLLEFAVRAAEQNNAALVCFDYEDSDGVAYNPKELDFSKVKCRKNLQPLFLGCGRKGVPFSVWTKLYRRDALEGIEFIPKIHFEDYPHTYAVLSKHPKAAVLDAKLYFYTKRQDNISNSKDTAQRIRDYVTGINYVYDIYKNDGLAKERNFLKRSFIPMVLKHQLGRCRRASAEAQPEMWKVFSEELADLAAKNMLSWRGHKLSRYFTYRKLIKACK